MKVKVLVENTEHDIFCGEHGLSLYIEYQGHPYLIDTGASGMYSENAKKMGVDLSGIEMAFLSHAHYDHSGGYEEFFAANDKAKVYLQQAAQKKYYYKIAGPIKKYIGIPKGILDKFADRFVYVDGYRDFGNGIYILPHTTPELETRGRHARMYYESGSRTEADDFAHEQSVVFTEEDGLVIFNSCSHGGVENIIEEVKRVFPDQKIKAFLGGFHMMGLTGTDSCGFSEDEVKSIGKKLKESSDAVFYSGHCTGKVAFVWLVDILGERMQAFYSGMEIEL